MFVSYTREELNGKSLHWLDEEIAEIQYVRAYSYEWTATKNWVNQDEHPPVPGRNRQYRHFIPRQKIVDALIVTIASQGMTRKQAFVYLMGVIETLEIPPDDHFSAPPDSGFELMQEQERPYTILEYNSWLTWAIEAIADWRGNIYRGFGLGDGNGTKLDVPFSPNNAQPHTAFVQYNRCLEYSLILVCEIVPLRLFMVLQMQIICEGMKQQHWTPDGVQYTPNVLKNYLRLKAGN